MAYKDSHINDMPYLSEQGRKMEQELKALSDQYHYRKLPRAVSETQRAYYMEELDAFWRDGIYRGKEIQLTTHDGTVLATGVTERGFVCGDYGVFLEIDPQQMCMEHVKVAPGQEYRINDPKYADHVKYRWYTDTTGDGIKLYFQQKPVTYADYQPGKWYISPYEVTVEVVREKKLPHPDAENHLQELIERAVLLERTRILEALKNGAVKMVEAKGNPWDTGSHKYYKAVSLNRAEEVITAPFTLNTLMEETLRGDCRQAELELE